MSATAEGTRPAPKLTFERHEVTTGFARRQTVVTGHLLGGASADLAVVSVEDNGERHLGIYAFEGDSWVLKIDVELGPRVLFVDVVDVGDRDRLITFERGRLNWFDPDSASERALIEVSTSYDATPAGLEFAGADAPSDAGDVPHVDISRDLNRDGRDDLIFPGVDGFQVFVQMSDGTFADPLVLGPPEPFRDRTALGDPRTYGQVGISPLTIPWYLSRVHQLDHDRDGRSDLVFWNEDHFDVHHQDDRGLFSPVAETFTVYVPFDSDGAYSLIFGLSDKSTFSWLVGLGERNSRTALQSIRDMNSDGVPDLVTHSLEGRSLRQRSRYGVHFGTSSPDGLVFSPDPDTTIHPQGRAGLGETAGYSSVWLRDFDGDGRIDVLRSDVEIGVGSILRALLLRSVTLDADLYRMEGAAYPGPDASTGRNRFRLTSATRFRASFDPHGGRDAGFFPAMRVGDVNGDGRSDVVVGKSREQLLVYLGEPGPGLLAREPRQVTVSVPGDERNSRLVDLDRDGRQDILLLHPSVTGPHRVMILMARPDLVEGSGRIPDPATRKVRSGPSSRSRSARPGSDCGRFASG